MKQTVLFLILFFSALQGAEILQLVRLLDLNDTVSFEKSVQSAIDANAMRSDNNKTILMYACWVGNEEAVHHLVSKGADVNAQDENGASALHLAIWKERTPIALYLIDHGASGSLMSKDGMSPLDIAMLKGNKEVSEAIEKSAPKLKPLL